MVETNIVVAVPLQNRFAMALSDEEFDSLGFTFVWRIENFSHGLEQRNSCIESPNFRPAFSSYLWNMKIYPRGNKHDDAITYQINNNVRKSTPISFELNILCSNGSLKNVKELENLSYYLLPFSGILIEQEDLFGEKKDIYLSQDTLTLRLRMWLDLPSWLGQIFARTHIGVQKRAITWKIPQFSDKKPSAYNKIFEIKTNFKENITLNLYLKNSFKCNDIYFLDISETDISQDNLISIEIAVLDLSGSRIHLCTGEHWFEKGEEKNIWNFPISVSRSTLLTNKSRYLPDDTLTLQCYLALSVGVVYSELEFVEESSFVCKEKPYLNSSIPEIKQPQRNIKIVSEHQESLSTDLLRSYTEGANSDFELRAGSSKFPTHKFILMARSPVFQGMLSSDMVEKNTSVVDIPDLDSDTVKRMLHFMYTDAIEVAEWGAISNLYFAADKYRIESLKKKCSAFLERNICASNLYEALEFGDLHQCPDLKVSAMAFLIRNDHEILTSEEWMQFSKRNGSLAAEVMHWMYLKKVGKK